MPRADWVTYLSTRGFVCQLDLHSRKWALKVPACTIKMWPPTSQDLPILTSLITHDGCTKTSSYTLHPNGLTRLFSLAPCPSSRPSMACKLLGRGWHQPGRPPHSCADFLWGSIWASGSPGAVCLWDIRIPCPSSMSSWAALCGGGQKPASIEGAMVDNRYLHSADRETTRHVHWRYVQCQVATRGYLLIADRNKQWNTIFWWSNLSPCVASWYVGEEADHP